MNSFDKKGTWVLDPNPKVQPLPSHLVLKLKRLADSYIDRFKAREFAGENFQVFGENYTGSYTPLVAFPTVGIFLYIEIVE